MTSTAFAAFSGVLHQYPVLSLLLYLTVVGCVYQRWIMSYSASGNSKYSRFALKPRD